LFQVVYQMLDDLWHDRGIGGIAIEEIDMLVALHTMLYMSTPDVFTPSEFY